jgi:S-adenosyl-L-methionine hydrolase (adenosine-forming)
MDSPKIVTLTSDFGLKDPYVAEMKGVVLSVCPTAIIVDITHEVEKFNVREGAFVLASTAPYYPKGTVHIAVVDPTVGTGRRPIIVETEDSFFVGPDNGVLMLAAEAQHIKQMRHVESRRFMRPHVSNTFHGRDVFAPVAGHLLNGVSLEEFGPQITEVVKPKFVQITRSEESVSGEVLHVDDFGNIITNIPAKVALDFTLDAVMVEMAAQKPFHMKMARAYADVKHNEPVALVGSHSYLEIAVNQGNAAAKFSVKAGDSVFLSKP